MDEVGPGGGRGFGLRDGLLAAFVVLCLGANIWPGYAWFGNSIEPVVLALPFSLVWIVGWVLLSFVAVAAYHATGPEDGE